MDHKVRAVIIFASSLSVCFDAEAAEKLFDKRIKNVCEISWVFALARS